jgi:hypothetical protein
MLNGKLEIGVRTMLDAALISALASKPSSRSASISEP